MVRRYEIYSIQDHKKRTPNLRENENRIDAQEIKYKLIDTHVVHVDQVGPLRWVVEQSIILLHKPFTDSFIGWIKSHDGKLD